MKNESVIVIPFIKKKKNQQLKTQPHLNKQKINDKEKEETNQKM